MDIVNLAIIGYGKMGKSHAKNIQSGLTEGIRLAAVCDTDEQALNQAKSELCEDILLFDDADKLLKARVCDAVLIATPHYLHPGLSVAALKAGYHVICEKPAGVYTKQVRLANEIAAESDRVFALMFNQRTNPIYRRMRELVISGELGEIKRVNWIITNWYRPCAYYASGGWRATWAGEGGGVLLNQCPHNLDLLQWICGMPVSVRAFCHEGKWHDIEVEDDVTAYMTFENGATGVFITSTADAPGSNRFEITGTRGKLVCENKKLSFYQLNCDEREFCATTTGHFSMPDSTLRVEEFEMPKSEHSLVLSAFAAKIMGKGELVAQGDEGIRGLELSNAMHLSSWMDKTISLPIDEQLFLDKLTERAKTQLPLI